MIVAVKPPSRQVKRATKRAGAKRTGRVASEPTKAVTVLPQWSTACIDWEDRIVNRQPLIPIQPLYYDEAVDGLETFKALRMVDAPGSPTFGEACDKWVFDFVASIFGAYDPEDGPAGIRRIQEFFLLISKKNGKSTIAAGIMMTAIIKNWRRSGEFLILAPTKEVADNAFTPARDMILNDPDLSELFHVQEHERKITHRVTKATLKVVAADNETVSGKKAIGILVDELWMFGKKGNANKMLMEATGGLASRPEGFIIYTSTQSDDVPAGVFKEKLEYARAVRDGRIVDPSFLPVIYEFPKKYIEQELYLLPENFYITNPSMGTAVRPEYIKRKLDQAGQGDEDSLQGVLAKHLNVEIGMNLMADRWPGADHWENCTVPERVTIDRLIDECEVIICGADGGGLDDLLGFNALGRKKKEESIFIPEHRDPETRELVPAHYKMVKKWLSFSHAWCHQIVFERRKSIETILKDLQAAGRLTVVEVPGMHTMQMAKMVGKIHAAGLLHEIGLDPAGLGSIIDDLQAENVPQEKMKGVNQGFRLHGSILTCENRLAEGSLEHDKDPLMIWCVANCKVQQKGNARVVTKQVSGTGKIDPVMALFNSVALMQLNPPAMSGTYDFDKMVIGG